MTRAAAAVLAGIALAACGGSPAPAPHHRTAAGVPGCRIAIPVVTAVTARLSGGETDPGRTSAALSDIKALVKRLPASQTRILAEVASQELDLVNFEAGNGTSSPADVTALHRDLAAVIKHCG